jgi:flagellar basal-body rod protein FlgC
MYGGLDISVSGMIAQRTRLNVIASNLANAETAVDPNGDLNAYRRRFSVLMPGDPSATTADGRRSGVHVADIMLDQGEFEKRYDPDNPLAMPDGPDAGYVLLPNIDVAMETVDMLSAQRSYEANLAAAEATKALIAQALRLLS